MVIWQSSDNLRTTCKLIGKSSEHLRQFDCLSEGIFGSSIVCRRASSAVRLFVEGARVTSVALGSSWENMRTSDNLRELFNRTKNRLLKILAEFWILGFPAYREITVFAVTC